jgi:hypothetical protein
MSDQHGLFEHALGDQPRRERGYCTDDVARALLLTSLAEDPPADLHALYLGFVVAAVAADGTCHNRRSRGGNWTDEPGVGDWWGRAVWGLAAAVASGRGSPAADAALARSMTRRSPFRRSMAYATLGAAASAPHSPSAQGLLNDALSVVARHDRAQGSAPGLWPEPRLSYDNAVIPHALIAGGDAAGRDDLIAEGLAQLAFLVDTQQHDGHLSLVPAGGRDLFDPSSGFDQQPIEAAGLALAAAAAFDATGEERWRHVVGAAAGWFLGDNDSGTSLVNEDTGAGYDGLTADGRNLNQGAESTLAANLTFLQAERLGVSACPPPSDTTPARSSIPTPTVSSPGSSCPAPNPRTSTAPET